MSLSIEEIAQVLGELDPLCGAALQRAWAPEPRTCVLRLRGGGRTALLLVSAETDLARLHVASERLRGEGPAPFQEALRAELEGLRLVACEQKPRDRVVHLRWAGPDRERTLVAELTGRHGNLFILDEQERVLHSAVPNLSRRRENVRGRPYRPTDEPPAASRASRPSRFAAPMPSEAEPFPTSRVVEAVYGPETARVRLDEARRVAARPLRTAAARLERILGKLDEDAARAAGAERYRRWGELLKPSLHQLKKGQTGVVVTDWFEEGAPEVRIPLQPELGPKENLERFFHLYRRFAEAPRRIERRREDVEAELAGIRDRLARLEAAEDADTLREVAEAARAAGFAPPAGPARRPDEARKPYRLFRSATGRPILVGRGAVDNDALTFRVARGNDLWLHVRGFTGSHVVVQTGGREEVDEQTLLDAATLAVHFSRAAGEHVADVAWTFRKHVRKPKGAPPGAVTFSQDRGLTLRSEPGRLARLMVSEER